MDTIFINSGNSKTFDFYWLLLNLTNKIKSKKIDKYVVWPNISIYYMWQNIKKSYRNNKFEILALMWNEEFELSDGSYSVSDIKFISRISTKSMK